MKTTKSIRAPKKKATANPIIQFPERFVFRGNAVAAGAIINSIGSDKTSKAIPVQGQSALPTIGGHSESVVQASDPAYKQVFSYGELRTQADGILRSSGAVTTVSASVKNLRMVNHSLPGEAPDLSPVEFKADLLSLEMRSTYPRKGPARIEFSKTPVYQGLYLGGLPVVIELRKEFLDLAVMADLERRFHDDEKFFLDCKDAFMLPDPKKPPKFRQAIPRMNDYAVCSIVRSIQVGNGPKTPGHVLAKTGFGTIYFGEMLVSEYNRRVTLVRVKMGSNVDADVIFGEGDPNGTWIPPED